MVPEVRHEPLGGEGLARGPGGAGVLASPALGAGQEIEQLLAAEAAQGGDPEVLGLLEVHPVERAGSVRGALGDGEGRRHDVADQREGEKGDEAEGQDRVRPPRQAMPEKLRGGRQSGEGQARHPAAGRPGRPGVSCGRNAEPLDEVSAHEDGEQQGEKGRIALGAPGVPQAAGTQAVPPQERRRHAEGAGHPEEIHGERHEVEIERAAEDGQPQVVLEGDQERGDDEDPEPPGDGRVNRAGERVAQEAQLHDDLRPHVAELPGGERGPGVRLPAPDGADQPESPVETAGQEREEEQVDGPVPGDVPVQLAKWRHGCRLTGSRSLLDP